MITLNDIRLLLKHYVFIKQNNGPEKWTEMNYFGFDFNLDSYLGDIKKYQDRFKIKNCYSTNYQDKDYQTLEIDWVGSGAKKRILISAGMHGNEISGVWAIPRILNNIIQDPDYYKDWEIKIITPVNPVGVIMQSRYNKDGYDINRDFKKFNTLEAKKLKEIFFDFKPDLILNFHEAPHAKGSMVLANHSSNKKKVYELADRLDTQIDLAKRHYMKTHLEKKGLEREGWFLVLLEKLFTSPGLEQMADDQGVTSLTVESSWQEKDREKRTIPHIIVLKEVIDIFK